MPNENEDADRERYRIPCVVLREPLIWDQFVRLSPVHMEKDEQSPDQVEKDD